MTAVAQAQSQFEREAAPVRVLLFTAFGPTLDREGWKGEFPKENQD